MAHSLLRWLAKNSSMAARKHNGTDRRLELLKQGARLYQEFTGHGDEFEVHRVNVPGFPASLSKLVAIGECAGILYDTVRDGEIEKYIHRFRKGSRPLFCVTPDGNQIVLLGGAYKFTDRGIVDK